MRKMFSCALRERRNHVEDGRRDVRLVISIVVALVAFVLAARKFAYIGNLVHDDILMDVSLGLELGVRVEVHVVLLRNFDMAAGVWRRPDVRAVGGIDTVEDVVKGKFYGGSRNAEPVRRSGPNAFPIAHTIRNGRCWIQ
jgi:hypothetical protein